MQLMLSIALIVSSAIFVSVRSIGVVEVCWHCDVCTMVGPNLSYSPLEKWSMPSLEKVALIVSAAIIGGGRCFIMLAHVLVGLVL